jgi:hypothetical protein
VHIPADLLAQTVSTGPNEQRGTWVHPQVAIHLAMWCSATFAVQVTTWVEQGYVTRRNTAFTNDLSYDHGLLPLIREVRTLLQALDMYEDQDRLLLADHVRHVLLVASGRKPLPGATAGEIPEGARVWSVGDRIVELGYPQRFVDAKDRRVAGYLAQIGRTAAQAYRVHSPGAEPEKGRRCVDGAARPGGI